MNGINGIFEEMRKERTNSLNEENTQDQASKKGLTSEQKRQLREEVEAEKAKTMNEAEEGEPEIETETEAETEVDETPLTEIDVKRVRPGDVIRVSETDDDFVVESVDQVPIEKSENSCFVIRDKSGDVKYFNSDDKVLLVNEEKTDEECGDKKMNETTGLDVKKKATNGRAFTVEINGKKYSYYPTEESGLTAKELGEKYNKIAKYSQGKALSWLKKNATTPDSYRKKTANEEQEDKVNEEMTIIIDAKDILKAATEIEKAESEGKTVVVKQTADGFKIEAADAEEGEPEEEPEAEEECGDKDEEETCPVCGKKHKKGTKCCEEKDSVNEEIDVAELAARLDECEGSDYMHKALEEGKYDLVKKYLYLKED